MNGVCPNPAQDADDTTSQAPTEAGDINGTLNNEARERLPPPNWNAYPGTYALPDPLPNDPWAGALHNATNAVLNPDKVSINEAGAVTISRDDSLPFFFDGRPGDGAVDAGGGDGFQPQGYQENYEYLEDLEPFIRNYLFETTQGGEQCIAENVDGGMPVAPEAAQEENAHTGNRIRIKPWQKKDAEAMRTLKWSGFKFDDRFDEEDETARRAGE